MNYTVNRLLQTKTSTIGTFEINGLLTYYTLEPPNPIPAGRYKLGKYLSPKHGFYVPILIGVPNHSFVEIHVGNTAASTRDCLLLGQSVDVNAIGNSKPAIASFYTGFFAELAKGDCYITYKEIWT